MKAPYVEGVANHDGPESCGCIRKVAVEALTGVRAGRDIEPRNQTLQSTDAVIGSGRPPVTQRQGEPGDGPARSKTPSMCGLSVCENREIPWPPALDGEVGRKGGGPSPQGDGPSLPQSTGRSPSRGDRSAARAAGGPLMVTAVRFPRQAGCRAARSRCGPCSRLCRSGHPGCAGCHRP